MSRVWLAVFLFLTLFLGTSLAKDSTAKATKDVVVAQVGSYKLTKAEFEEMVKNAPPQIQMLLAHQPALKEGLLRRWAEVTLLAMAAKEEGLDKVPEVKARIQDVVDRILAQEYLSKKVLPQVKPVTDKEAKAFYESHKQAYTNPEAIHARHILIAVPQNASKKQEEAALKKAQEIRKRALKGEDFAMLAKKYSADPGTKDKGGDLGFVTRGQLIEDFEKAAFALKPGEISQPVRTPFGYHIIKMEERRPASQKSFAEVKEQVKEELTQQRQEAALKAALHALEVRHPIKIYPDRLK